MGMVYHLKSLFQCSSWLTLGLGLHLLPSGELLAQADHCGYTGTSYHLQDAALHDLLALSLQEEETENLLDSEEKTQPKKGYIRSGLYRIPGRSLEHGGIGFINGIYTTLEEGKIHAQRLSSYAQNAEISYVHNATRTIAMDLCECVASYFKVPTPPVQLLIQQWQNFVATHDKDAKFLQIAHSLGAIHVKNALLFVDEELRSRIIVLAIAPAAVISSDLCCVAYNYTSKVDMVPYFDVAGARNYQDELRVLEPDPDAGWFDHYFDSPTFSGVIQGVIEEFLSVYDVL